MSIATAVEFREAVLPNGLTVQAEIVPGAMTSAAGFFFRTGARDEASPVMGVSHFLEHMMFKGSAKRRAGPTPVGAPVEPAPASAEPPPRTSERSETDGTPNVAAYLADAQGQVGYGAAALFRSSASPSWGRGPRRG